MTLDTMIVHESGEWIEGSFEIPLGKTDPQGAGSAISYARRYALMAALNMPAVDDDGNAASKRQEPQGPERSPGMVSACNVAIGLCKDVPALTAWLRENKTAVDQMHPDDRDEVTRLWNAKKHSLSVMKEAA
jgi:hypothetical protein